MDCGEMQLSQWLKFRFHFSAVLYQNWTGEIYWISASTSNKKCFSSLSASTYAFTFSLAKRCCWYWKLQSTMIWIIIIWRSHGLRFQAYFFRTSTVHFTYTQYMCRLGFAPPVYLQIMKKKSKEKGLDGVFLVDNTMLWKSNLTLSLKRRLCNQCILPVLTWIRNLECYESPGTKTSNCSKGNGENNAWHNIERKRASWIRDQTKVEDIPTTIKKNEVYTGRTHDAINK